MIVDPSWFPKLASPTEDEEDMLDLAFDLQETSRLGCQIIMTEKLDGLVVKLPAGGGKDGKPEVALEFLDDEQVKRNLLDDIREMERLIADLLESERMNVGHTTLRRTLVDLSAMLTGLVSEEFQEQAARIELKLPPGVVVREVDEVRMRLIAKNLIENALRYTPPDAAPVAVELTVKPGMVLLQIRDHGPGIAGEHLPKISQAFYRADPARSRSTGGLGLGLYLARRIAEAHNGSLVIESELGQGTLVTVTLHGDRQDAATHGSAVFKELSRIEDLTSFHKPSMLNSINDSSGIAPVRVSEEPRRKPC